MWKLLMSLWACLALIASNANAEIPQIEVCDASDGPICEIKEVRVTPCKEAGTKNPCKFKRSTNSTIEFDFVPHFDSEKMMGVAYWSNAVADVPFPGMDRNACKSISCPVVKNQLSTYKNVIFMSPYFPAFSYVVKWKIWDHLDSTKECCFTLKIKIVA